MDLFKSLLANVEPVLETYGFKRKNALYICETPDGWCVLEIQKGRSSSDVVRFTINIGIVIGSIVLFTKPDLYKNIQSGKNLDDSLFHWSKRIGYCVPDQKDLWWDLASDEDIRTFVNFFTQMSIKLIPDVKSLVDMGKMRDSWIAGVAPGLTNFQRLQYLSVLVTLFGPHEMLETLLGQLFEVSRNRPTSHLVDLHVKKIREYLNQHNSDNVSQQSE